MSKDPAFLFYAQDWITGTLTMTMEERGQYITILAVMHQTGRLDEKTISFLVGNVSDNLKNKFSIDTNGLWFNTRLEEEMDKRAKFAESRRKNGLKGGRPKASVKPSGKPNGKPINNHTENEDEYVIDVNKEDLFEKFWTLYSKGVTRIPSQREWSNIDKDEYIKILEHVPKYVKATPKYRKDPVNYLKDRAWLDPELPKQTVSETEKPKERFVPTPPKYT